MWQETDVVAGELLGAGGHRVRTAPAGRVCKQAGCTVVLSIYNARERCAAHDFDHRLADFGLPRSPSATKATASARRARRRDVAMNKAA